MNARGSLLGFAVVCLSLAVVPFPLQTRVSFAALALVCFSPLLPLLISVAGLLALKASFDLPASGKWFAQKVVIVSGELPILLDKLWTPILGPTHNVFEIDCLMTLAGAYAEDKQALKAMDVLSRVNSLIEAKSEKDPTKAASVFMLMADFLNRQHQYAQSAQAGRKALALMERSGREPLLQGATLTDLCSSLKKQGNIVEAINAGQSAVAILEPCEDRDSQRVLSMALNNLALAYNYACRFSEAKVVLERALDLKKKLLGTKNRSLAIGYENMAEAEFYLQNFDQAKDYIETAYSMLKELGYTGDEVFACVLEDRGAIFHALGKFADAEKELLASYNLRSKLIKSGPDLGFLNVFRYLGKLYRDQHEYEKSKKYFLEALNVIEKCVDRPFPKLTFVYADYAELLKMMGQESEALVFERRAKEMISAL